MDFALGKKKNGKLHGKAMGQRSTGLAYECSAMANGILARPLIYTVGQDLSFPIMKMKSPE